MVPIAAAFVSLLFVIIFFCVIMYFIIEAMLHHKEMHREWREIAEDRGKRLDENFKLTQDIIDTSFEFIEELRKIREEG